MNDVVCFVETDGDDVVDASLRAVTFARSAAPGRLHALVAAEPSTRIVEQLGEFGVQQIRHLSVDGVTGYAPLAIAAALGELFADEQTCAVVAAATDHGNEILAHLGARAGFEFVANCTSARRRDDGQFDVVRQRWGGSLIEEAVLRAPRGLFSVTADAVTAVPSPTPAAPEVRSITPSLTREELGLQAVESRRESAGVSLASAKVVVSGGRGVGSPEAFAVLEKLADLLGGAVGVSRVVTSLGWRPHREQVGQTGTKVTPDLYLACGISGAIQHLAGCQGAKHMIAINTDPDAPIMARADYAVIGDVATVLPALVSALEARRSTG